MKNTKVEKAVAPGDIELTLGPEKGSNYSPNVLTISGGKLLSGDMLKEEGTTANDPIPWRVHDTLYFGSEGCFVGRKDNPKGSVANVIDKLKFWEVEYGDKIQGKLLIEIDGRVYGGQ
jgi:hypothetical protein